MSNSPTARRWLFWLVAAGVIGAGWLARSSRPVARHSVVGLALAAMPSRDARDIRDGVATSASPTKDRQTQTPRALFTFAQPANAAHLDATLPAPTHAIHYVRLNAALIAGKQSPFWKPAGQGRIEIPLPGGGALAVVIEGSEMLGPDRFTSTGHLEGQPQSRAIFAFNRGFMHASIVDPERGNFALRPATEELSQFYQVDPALLPPCGGPVQPVIDASVLAAAEARRAKQAALAGATPAAPAMPGTAAAENSQRAEVHVMMVYTQAVRADLTGATRLAVLQSAFDAAIAKANDAFAASLVTARLKLARIYETNYSADGSTGNLVSGLHNEALTALSTTTDGRMDDVHAARDQAGADIVMLTMNRQDVASIGLSYVLTTAAVAPDTTIANFNPLFAFAVVEYGAMTSGTNVVPHELGHVFGCSHQRDDRGPNGTPPSPGAFSYSYGYRFTASNGLRYHDIMAYFPGTELSYFSNPNLPAPAPAPTNSPGGIARGQPGESDTAGTIEQTAFEVSTFRLQTLAAANPGTLINVSTRAFVGTGDNVLIGGFVVNGTQPKKMLIRAAGPELLNYGVTNVLADPVLKIYRGSAEIAGNDNWGSNAAEVSAARAVTGAFAFANGSADAALVINLQPGAYTAIVEGKAGATGSGLVEAYDVDRTGNKVVNLSTRGYADRNGKEMFGGFIVQGAPGTTKRVLVRVLGPTLSRPPFNMSGVMEDPCLEVYSATGALLMQNDDWSTGSEGPTGNKDDFKPTVTYYGEQQITATGRAPTNRREPCVLLDLLPGSYTVIVKPFERRDPNPEDDQPAQPGVGIVEVYEIDP